MSQSSASRTNPQQAATAQQPSASKRAGHVCPFCGTVRDERATPCPHCTMEDTTATRQATRARIGPWYVLQQRNPSAPGMRFDTLLTLVKRGQVSARSIVRGPTTHQLWRFAARVRGLSREFGLCYSCGAKVEPTGVMCDQCHKMQEPPANPDVLLESKPSAKSIPAVRREIPSARPVAEHDAATDLVLPTLGGAIAGATIAKAPVGAPPVPASPAAVPQPAKSSATPIERKVPERPTKPAAPAPRAERSEQSKPSGGDQKGRLPASTRPLTSVAADASDASVDGGARPILSAKELAAAFRLDFIPQPGQTDSAASATTKKRRRRPWALAILVLLVSGAATVYLTPTLRSQAATWGNQTYQRLHDKWASFQNGNHGLPDAKKPADDAIEHSRQGSTAAQVNTPKPSDDAARNNAANGAQAGDEVDSAQPAEASGAPLTLRHLPVPGVGRKAAPLPGGDDDQAPIKPPPADAQSHATPASPPAKPGPWDQLKNAAAANGTAAEPTPHATPTANTTTPPPAAANADEASPSEMTGDHSEKIRELWIAAIDAEGSNNYPRAVKLYEQIKQYPEDQWPVSLELRLEQVKRQIRENGK